MRALPSRKERLTSAIDRWADVVEQKRSDITNKFIFQVIYFAVLIVSCILTNLKPNWGSLIGTVGLGGLSLKANIKAASEAWDNFSNARIALIVSVTHLRGNLDLCSEDDDECLDNVETLIREVLEDARN